MSCIGPYPGSGTENSDPKMTAPFSKDTKKYYEKVGLIYPLVDRYSLSRYK